ncbi:MAG: hypothetical protein IJ685_03870 [Selenomonadaceae bacterium]|nr:hypothetical protein [Selenomonadaceae bacterium]
MTRQACNDRFKSGGTVDAPKFQIIQTLLPRRSVKNIKCSALADGERGKIYIDVDTGAQYRWSGSQFVQISSAVSTADRAVNDADGNSITATYATKAELATLSETVSTNALTVGNNISVDENGEISLTASNVTGALGYTPLSENNVLSDGRFKSGGTAGVTRNIFSNSVLSPR